MAIALGVRRWSRRGHCSWCATLESSSRLLLVCIVRVVVVSVRGLPSFAGLLVVVVVEQPGSWVRWIPGRGFESHRGGLESGVTA